MRTAFAAAVGGLVLAVVVSIAAPAASHVAAVLALVALALGLPRVRRSQLAVGLLLLGVGVVALAVAGLLGHRVEPLELLDLNQDLLGMLAAAAFLGVVARPGEEPPPRLHGAPAVWRTSFVTHLLGSVINLSALTVVGDHLRRDGTLRPADAMILTRSFSSAGFWSPFWAGTGFALAFAPAGNIGLVVAVGLPLAAAVLAVSMFTVFRTLGEELPDYRGYALSWRLLRLPLLLMASVLGLRLLLPEVSMPRLVALAALVVVAVVVVARERSRALRVLSREAARILPNLGGESVLFVSAGVMAIGLSALTGALDFTLPVDEYSVPLAWAGILATTLLALLGVHHVISIGFIGSLVLPLHPDPTLFVLAATISWGTASAVGPLTAVQMYLQGRYRLNGVETSRRNLVFLVASLLLSLPALFLVSWLSGLVAGG